MPIEIRCPGCEKLLRVPDSAAGKQARCPNCQQEMAVPASASGGDGGSIFGDLPSASAPKPASPGIDLFSDAGAASAPAKPSPDPTNPYASSGFFEPSAPVVSGGPLTPQRVSFEDAFSLTWNVFVNNLGPMVVIGVLIVALYFAHQGVVLVLQFGAEMTGDPGIIIIANLIANIIGFFVIPIPELAGIAMCLKLMRTGRSDAGDFMLFTQAYGRCLLRNLVVVLAFIGVAVAVGVFVGIAAALQLPPELLIIFVITGYIMGLVVFLYFFIGYFLSMAFMLDRRMGPIESMKTSWRFMEGNKLVVFAIMFVLWLISIPVLCCTLFLGSVAYFPIYTLMGTVIYLLATGQRGDIQPSVLGVGK